MKVLRYLHHVTAIGGFVLIGNLLVTVTALIALTIVPAKYLLNLSITAVARFIMHSSVFLMPLGSIEYSCSVSRILHYVESRDGSEDSEDSIMPRAQLAAREEQSSDFFHDMKNF